MLQISHLEDEQREGNANEHAELSCKDAAVVRAARGRHIAHVAAQQPPQRGGAQEESHEHAGRKVAHAQQLQVQCEEHQRGPGNAADNALRPAAFVAGVDPMCNLEHTHNFAAAPAR